MPRNYDRETQKRRERRKRNRQRENPLWHSLLLEITELCDATGTVIPNIKEMSITALQEYRDALNERFKRQEQNHDSF